MNNLNTPTLLDVKNLSVTFWDGEHSIKAVDDINFSIHEAEVVGLIGESGSGKTVTALSLINLLNQSSNCHLSGQILLNGEDILRMPPKLLNKFRGKRVSIVFQDPMTCLHPLVTIGHQLMKTIRLHTGCSKNDASSKALSYLDLVGIPDPEKRFYFYAPQFSGGMRQRIMIALALCCEPDLLIADEPTSSLDRTIQTQILRLLLTLKAKLGFSILLITHDLEVVSSICSKVFVMKSGKIVETGDVNTIVNSPKHPYTRSLMEAAKLFQKALL